MTTKRTVRQLGHENICRLDVAMNNPSRVSRIESIGDLHSQTGYLLCAQRLARYAMLTWIDLKEKLGGGTKAILESAEKGEDSARDAYEKALTDEDLPPSVRPVIQRQAESVRLAHDRVRTLRDSAKAA